MFLDSGGTTGVNGFTYSLITSSTGLDSVGGIFGLSRSYAVGGYTPGPLLVAALAAASQITANKYAFMMATLPVTSFV